MILWRNVEDHQRCRGGAGKPPYSTASERSVGKFPVISISLKSVGGLQYDSAAAALRTVIGNEAGRFRFLRESSKLDEDDKNFYNQLVNVETKGNSKYAMPDDALIDSLKTLSQLLEKHYAQKVICWLTNTMFRLIRRSREDTMMRW